MKRIIPFILLVFTLNLTAWGQDEERGEKVRERLVVYMKNRLDLSKSEAERFTPLFLNYFNELRQTNQQYRDDRLLLQQKVADLRLRYRDQFKPIMGDKRSNDVFNYERDFIEGLKQLRQERMLNRNNGPLNRRPGGLLP